MNSNTLTFEQTNRLKGLLILLIVFGHISQLLEQLGSLHATLYSFHVVSFLLLPFLFNSDYLTKKNIVKNLRRIYVPYTLFFLLALSIFSFLENRLDPLSALSAWGIGSSALLKTDIGLRVFWFFPALMSTILLIMFYNGLSLKKRQVLLFGMLILHLSIPFIPKAYLFYFPLSSYISMYLFIIGITINYLYKNFNYSKYAWFLSGTFIALLIFSYGSDFSLASAIFPNIKDNPLNFILQDLVMISSFFTLILWSRKIKFLETFGEYSLAIFTLHPFIVQALNKAYLWESFTEGIIKFILVIIITYSIVRVLYFFKINKFIYPR